jgi:surface antigen
MSKALGSNAAAKPLAVARRGFRRLSKGKLSVAAIYFGAFVLLVVIVSVGYYRPNSSPEEAGAIDTNTNAIQQIDQAAIDDVLATGVAATVAQSANLPIATSVSNLAVSAEAKSAFVQTDSISAVKPQIISSAEENRAVISYTVKAGDTVTSLAKKYKISAQTIKWANDLTSDALDVGDVLRILPVNGILYSVKSGDSIDSIAKKYKVDKTRLVVYNDLDVSGIKSNKSIILPDGILPETERPGYVAPVVINYYAGIGSGFGGRTWYIATGTASGPYAYGNCTLYAYNRRVQLGLTASSQWGNASSWAYMAGASGLLVNNSPSVGAIIQNGGGLGHVGIVEELLPNGDVSISEMNAYVSGGGWNIVSGRIVQAGDVSRYLYIH